jgi:excisionase family DNA binding protein
VPDVDIVDAKRYLAACIAATKEPEVLPKTLTPPEVAKQLGADPATVINWIRSGQLKASNLATGARPRYVIRPEDLDKFLGSRQPDLRKRKLS